MSFSRGALVHAQPPQNDVFAFKPLTLSSRGARRRIQIAYARFWEGATNLRTLSAKLLDGVMHLVTFDELPPLLPSSVESRGRTTQPAVFDEVANTSIRCTELPLTAALSTVPHPLLS